MFKLKGDCDSTTSDILFENSINEFYIEAKMPNAQSGQFVLFPDVDKKVFKYSSKNKSSLNEYTRSIINFMDNSFDNFYNSKPSGNNIEMTKSVFYNWIINHYKNKGVRFFITKGYDDDFIIFPIEKFPKYFDVSAKYRVKKSGSSNLNNSNKPDLENALKSEGINYHFDGLDIVTATELDGKKINSKSYNYLFRKDKNKYKVKKLSNTKNANVIFSIRLLVYDAEEQKYDILEFEKIIKGNKS
ncbi:Uncharacterised protein [Metamycoplasma arthritidis]|uniref:Uncharacterized protein n=1 Tax=Metamycoplasma arthritidis (strain 158L3-1) TaxID=243272 RepID=B3PM24_META1|nr:hypothetical protein [Metamycoplasma arthritidis]ACF07076.1 conserved hypothetical protein [Metamycoplasma arthritidis 158L3-1]VEU78604.1 Uncharacterised protein [Metamycoplasma arthritidis]